MGRPALIALVGLQAVTGDTAAYPGAGAGLQIFWDTKRPTD